MHTGSDARRVIMTHIAPEVWRDRNQVDSTGSLRVTKDSSVCSVEGRIPKGLEGQLSSAGQAEITAALSKAKGGIEERQMSPVRVRLMLDEDTPCPQQGDRVSFDKEMADLWKKMDAQADLWCRMDE